MKYGRTHYDIEGAGLEHQSSIISPSSTLAVRGTNVSLFDQPPFKPEAISYTGRAPPSLSITTPPFRSEQKGTFVRAPWPAARSWHPRPALTTLSSFRNTLTP